MKYVISDSRFFLFPWSLVPSNRLCDGFRTLGPRSLGEPGEPGKLGELGEPGGAWESGA